MSTIWDVISIDTEIMDKYAKDMQDSSDKIGVVKNLIPEDYNSTISANGNASKAISSMNDIRLVIGQYIGSQKEELVSISDDFKELEEDMTKRLSC